MKKASDVFKSIRFAKGEPRGKEHSSTDDEEHYTVGEKEFGQQLAHAKKRAMQEEKKDKYDDGEYDQEGDMAKSDLRSIIANAQKLHDMIDDADNLPEWCQSKITLAEDYVSTVANYMTAEMNEETVNEISDTTLSSYKEKAKKSADDLSAKGQYRKSTNRWGNIMKATGKQIEKTTASIKKSLNREETEHLDEIGDPAEMYRKATQAAKAKLQTMKALDKTREYEKKRLEAAKLKTQKEEVEQISEGRPSQRHPLEGHEYHKKTNAELEYIAKDAHKAAEAMKSHNTTAENKYRDQANDSATVRYFRKKNGMPDWYKKKYGHVNEEIEHLNEKNVPTSPEKWAQAKAQAKAKFDVYPSAYANGWAAKKYKEMGGGWKSVSEAKEEKPPFDPDPPRKQQVVAGKYGVGYSTARHLARMAMKKQSEKMKKPIKEEEMSKKAQIVKSVAKKKKDSAETFQKDPIISKSEVKM